MNKTRSILFRKVQRISSDDTDTRLTTPFSRDEIFHIVLSGFHTGLVNMSNRQSIQRGGSIVFFTILFIQCVLIQSARSMMFNENLSPCPDSPNCVSSRAEDEQHFLTPFIYRGTRSEAQSNLISILQSIPRTRLISIERNYIQVEFTSALFGFIDDAEFSFPENEKLIHVRSAARVGYYDFGVNRRRLERIRKLLTAESPP